jgi:hypothetical protein
MLDPTVGEGVVTAMRKEVHRMELRHAELLRVQERLMQVRWSLGLCGYITLEFVYGSAVQKLAGIGRLCCDSNSIMVGGPSE